MNPFVILIALFLACLVGGTIGFGDALILIPLIGLVIGMRNAVIMAGFWGIFLSFLNTMKYRKFLDKEFLKRLLIAGIPGVILGSIMIMYITIEGLELMLGIFTLTYACIKMRNLLKTRKENESRKIFSNSIVSIGGFTYGFLAGLIGASGPINVVLLEGTGHQREEFIGNFAMCSFCLTIAKLSVYIANDLFPQDLIWVYLTGFGVIYLATSLGHKLTSKIPKEKFQILVLIMLIIIGINSIANSF